VGYHQFFKNFHQNSDDFLLLPEWRYPVKFSRRIFAGQINGAVFCKLKWIIQETLIAV